MRRTRHLPSRLLVPLATAVALVTATPLSAAPPAGEPSDVEPPCVDPHACDYQWEGAELGPFELAHIEEVRVDSEDGDGTMLRGWLAFPDLPDGVRAPVALHSSPYLGWCSLPGECVPGPGNAEFWDDDPSPGVKGAWGVPPIELVRRGYVAAFFDVRGTGGSGGCKEWGGGNETLDQKVLVDWLAAQPCASGRVGMGRWSYPGMTPWQAAIQAPEALKTIVTAAVVTDWYTWFHTPQAMQHTAYPGLTSLGWSRAPGGCPTPAPAWPPPMSCRASLSVPPAASPSPPPGRRRRGRSCATALRRSGSPAATRTGSTRCRPAC